MGKNWLEDTILREVEEICGILRPTDRKPFDPKTHLTNSVSNVICALIFGQRFELTDPRFSSLTARMADQVQNIRVDVLAQALPILLWFPTNIRSQIERLRGNMRALAAFLAQQVKRHDTDISEQSDLPYKKAMAKSSGNTFTDDQLLSSLLALFIAGTETTATTTLWAFVFMIENPNVMVSVQQEIDNNVGREKILTSVDRGLLPYTEAVILEVQRCASLVPLGVFHSTHTEMIIDGYTILKGTILAANLFSIHRDIRWWKDPDNFNLHRFLDEERKVVIPKGFAPFSVGKRACLGESVAKMELFLFIANLLRCFTLELPPEENISSRDCLSGVTLSPKPFDIIFVPRV